MAEPRDVDTLKDASGAPIPQLWQPFMGAFIELEGTPESLNAVIRRLSVPDGQVIPAQIYKPIVREIFAADPEEEETVDENGVFVYTFETPITHLSVTNDAPYSAGGDTNVTFAVGDTQVSVQGGETFNGAFAPFTTVSFSLGGPIRGYGKA